METTYVSTRDEQRKCYTNIQWKLFSHKKEGNPAICDNMNETLGHYAKWKKSLC